MTDISPAAQAVLDAFGNASDGEYVEGVWVVNERTMLATALRAAVAHTQQHRGLGVWECDADELLAIAAELETSTTENR